MVSGNLQNSALESLSEEEKKVVAQILSQISTNGKSQLLDDIRYSDYKEIPVDIITFIKDDRYLGKAWHTSDGRCKLFPYWENKLKEIFPDNLTTAVNNFIESGARGLGKSEIAITIALYLMHRLMCLKDARTYYDIKPTEQIAFAFMNITETLSYDIGVTKFQNTVQLSPWFMERGEITGRQTKVWNPPEFIHIIVGSRPSHVIGQPIFFCLDGDTEILTNLGYRKIKELENKTIRVVTIDNNGQECLSDECTVKQTNRTTELYEIELEDGTIVKCTGNHRWMLADGTYKETRFLTENDELFDKTTPYGYVYKTTNNITNKVYIGQHKGCMFDSSYLGSGNLIQRSVKKYGKDKFKIELLEWCASKELLNERETYYIEKFNSMDPDIGYNIASGGQGGDLGYAVRHKISGSLRGHVVTEETRNKLSSKLTGNILSEETKQKISLGNKGKVVSEETRLKMSKAAKSRDTKCYGKNIGKIAITNGIDVKFIEKNIDIPVGWYRGNCNTSGKHDMSNYYSNIDIQLRNKESKAGCKNSMYHNGYRVSGGKNGKAIYRYYYKDLSFECRKELVEYLHSSNIDVPESFIKALVENKAGNTSRRRYKTVVDNLSWRLKNEDKTYN